MQIITPTVSLDLSLLDLQNLSEASRAAEARKWVTEEAQRPFNLTYDLLLRITVLRLNTQEHVLVFVMHHIISDGWSTGVFLREVSALYSAYVENKPSPLLDLPIQYADYAVWQRQWLQGKAMQSQLAYWKQQLAGVPSILELPTDQPRPAAQTFKGATYSFGLSTTLSASLERLSKSEEVTLFMVLLAAFQVLLARYSGQADIVVGSPFANRTRTEIEPLIGLFINTLVLRTELSGDPSFREVLRRVREVVLGAYAHQDLPFDKLVEELRPQRDLDRNPLFQVMFALQNLRNTSFPPAAFAGLKSSFWGIDSETSKFDLTLIVWEGDERLSGMLEYNIDLFRPATIERLACHLVTLLEAAVNSPDQRYSHLPLLTEPERHQILIEWNNTRRRYEKERGLHELFEAQAEGRPEAVAVQFEDEQLTYEELHRRSHQLALRLQRLGVSAETPVGVCLHRSVAMVVAILAILKAGGTYVPLDPFAPAERLAGLLQETQVPVLLTQRRQVGHLPATGARLLLLDRDWPGIAQEEAGPLRWQRGVEQLAYVLFTSGSTGTPKGVCCTHANVINLLADFQYRSPLGPGEHWSLWTNLSFDVSIYELFSALLSGGRLLLVPEELRGEVSALFTWLHTYQISSAYLPPFLLSDLGTWLKAGGGQLRLRRLLVGVEPIAEPVLVELARLMTGVQIINGYGPTETCICASLYDVPPVAERNRRTPIGRPVQNMALYLLDEQMQPVPVGVAAEVYIGGEGVARGYLHHAEWTAERFVPHRWSEQPGARLYRTGDRARYLPDGTIEFLGRLDRQVKLHGFRIEPGEIEAALLQHPNIRESAVIVREEASGDKRLIAYIVAAQQVSISPSELRDFLEKSLPQYMIPSAFIALSTLPLTPNSKVDRKALAALEVALVTVQEDSPAPRTLLEELLISVWSQILGVERIGVRDNFFALGGHSLLATQVVSRLRHLLHIELPLRRLFEAPTIVALAHAIEVIQQSESGVHVPPLAPMQWDRTIPLSFAQQRLWFLDQLEPGSSFYNIPVAWLLEGKLQVPALAQSLNILVERHQTLRTLFAVDNGRPVQVIASSLHLGLPVVNLVSLSLEEREAQAQRLQGTLAQMPFDLSRGPLLRACLLQLGEQEYVLLLTMHHIISDGWSMGILARELRAVYTALVQGKPLALASLPVQYADFTLWQRQWLQAEVLEAQLAYWKNLVADAPEVITLPLDHPRLNVQRFHGARLAVKLSASLSRALVHVSRQEGVTLFMLLLTAFQVLLSRYSGQEDVVVGTPIANRTQVELEGIVGFFVNTLALRTKLKGEYTVREAIEHVREVCLEAYAHQDLPFERLVEEVKPQRDSRYHPLFQVFFVLQNRVIRTEEWIDLKVQSLEVETDTIKFDLALLLEEDADSIEGYFEYSTDLFEEATIKRMAEHLHMVLEGMVADLTRPLASLPLLTSTELQLLMQWNATSTAYPRDCCIHELFEEQVKRTPEAIALVFAEEHLTYYELNRRANALAHHLRQLAVQPDTVVGLYLERSLHLLIGMVAILKAGGAYLPIDPSSPLERVEYMLQEAQIIVLLTQDQFAQQLEQLPVQVQNIEHWSVDATHHPEYCENSANQAKAENLAYIMYTSGSTGNPKGVCVTHRNVIRLVKETHYASFTSDEIFLLFTSISFDPSTFEIWGCLLNGGRLVVFPAFTPTLHELAQELAYHHITTLWLTAGLFHQMVEHQLAALCQVSRLLAGGDTLSASHVQRVLAQGHSLTLINGYGPTESTTFACCHPMSAGTDLRSINSVPIGRPIANTVVYVLDRYGQPAPVGVVGELYIGGDGLARGYLRRPELTAERFLPNPFSRQPGARLYRTGDRVRYCTDGALEFLGRVDRQVKVRGYRIEPGEIEAALRRHSAIQDAAVLVQETNAHEKYLAAYVVADEKDITVTMLYTYLQKLLPDYMIPQTFLILNALPLTPNGKVDYSALPIPDETRLTMKNSYAPPRDLLELQLVQIWKDILSIRQIGISDNFFDLGGHSLLVVHFLARIQEQFRKNIPLAQFFQNGTVEHVAGLLREQAISDPWSPLVCIQPGGARYPFFCVHAAGGEPSCYIALSQQLGSEQPFYGFQARGVYGEQALAASIEEMATSYIAALRLVQPEGPYLLGGWSIGGIVAFEMAQQLIAQGQDVKLLAMFDTFLPQAQQLEAGEGDSEIWADFVNSLALTGVPILPETSLMPPDPEPRVPFASQVEEILPSPSVMPAHLLNLFHVFENNVYISRRYKAGTYPGKIIYFSASERPKELHHLPLRWNRLAKEGADIYPVPGNHYTMLGQPHVCCIGELLRVCIANVC